MEKNEMMRPNTSAADTEGANAAKTVGEGEIAAAAETVGEREIAAAPETVGRLGLDLLGALGEEENSVISPLSAYLCLGLVKAGAAGATLGELDALLGEEPSFLYLSTTTFFVFVFFPVVGLI